MLVRVGFGLLLILATVLGTSAAVDRLVRRREALTWLTWLFVVSRVLGWAGTYVVVPDLAQYSDLVLYYYSEAQQAAAGSIPYRDFPTSYGFLFPWVAGALLPLWPARAAVAAMMVASEIAAVVLFTTSIRRRDGDPARLSFTLLLYILNPAALYWSGMLAYNSSLVLLFWVLTMVMVLAEAPALSLVALAGSVTVGKFLGVLAAPVALSHPSRRVGVLAGAGVAAVLLAGLGWHFGINPLLPLLREGSRSTSGNVWFLTSGLVPPATVPGVWAVAPFVLLAAGLAAFTIWWGVRWHSVPPTPLQVGAALSAIGWLFMVVSKKSYPHYTPMFILFTAYVVCSASSQRRRVEGVLLALLGAIGILEPGVWNALGQPQGLLDNMRGTAATWWMLVGQDCALVAGAAYFCARSCQLAVTSAESAPPR